MTKVTAIIPSLYKVDGDYLKLCVESLRDSGFDGDIIVVTNGTPTPEPLNIQGITRRLHTKDQGQCNAVNIGAQNATGEYLFIINSDMYFAPGWDKNLRFDYPVFSPNLVEPENNHGSADPFIKIDGGFTLEEFKKDFVDKAVTSLIPVWELDKVKKDESGLNFPLFIRKDLWDFLGGYDVAYDPWGSNGDTDLQTRINLAGVTPMRLRDVLVYHFSNKSGTFDFSQPERQAFYQNNIEYFRDKFGFDRDELGSDVWYNKDMLPTDPSKIKYHQEKYNG